MYRRKFKICIAETSKYVSLHNSHMYDRNIKKGIIANAHMYDYKTQIIMCEFVVFYFLS